MMYTRYVFQVVWALSHVAEREDWKNLKFKEVSNFWSVCLTSLYTRIIHQTHPKKGHISRFKKTKMMPEFLENTKKKAAIGDRKMYLFIFLC